LEFNINKPATNNNNGNCPPSLVREVGLIFTSVVTVFVESRGPLLEHKAMLISCRSQPVSCCGTHLPVEKGGSYHNILKWRGFANNESKAVYSGARVQSFWQIRMILV